MGKLSRNDLCPCGSRLKYKKCCLKNNKDKAAIQHLQSKKELGDRMSQKFGREVTVRELPLGEAKMSEVVLEFADSLLQHARQTPPLVQQLVWLAAHGTCLSSMKQKEREVLTWYQVNSVTKIQGQMKKSEM
jgi:hypothetical protein